MTINLRKSIFSFKFLILNSCLFIAGLLVAGPTYAQANDVRLSVSPATAFLKVKPGSETVHTIIIENRGIETLKITPKLVDFHPDGQTGRPVLGKKLTFPYFKLPEAGLKPITLDINQKAKVNLVISPPKDASTQEFPVTIIFQASNLNLKPDQTKVVGAVASNLVILVTKKENPPTKLKLAQIKLPKIIDSFQPLKFKLLAQNEGASAAIASGSAEILNFKEKVIAKKPILPTTILASSARYLLTNNLDSKPDNLSFNPETTEFLIPRRFWLGYYKLKVKLNPDQAQTQTFFALPISLVLLSLIGGLISGGLYLLRRQLKL